MRIHLVYLFVLCSYFSFSQDSLSVDNVTPSRKNKVEGGILHGINVTRLKGDGYLQNSLNRTIRLEERGSRLTMNFGFFVDYIISEKFSIDIEGQYIYMGGRYREETVFYHDLGTVTSDDYFSYYFDYFQFPLVFNYYPAQQIDIQFGGYVSSLISAEKAYPWYDARAREKLDGVASSDYGLVMGVGFNLDIVKLLFRYNIGLNNVVENDMLTYNQQVFQFTAQWKLFSNVK